jgi:hypothetical protein
MSAIALTPWFRRGGRDDYFGAAPDELGRYAIALSL